MHIYSGCKGTAGKALSIGIIEVMDPPRIIAGVIRRLGYYRALFTCQKPDLGVCHVCLTFN
jgi:hypothetical protein